MTFAITNMFSPAWFTACFCELVLINDKRV